MGADKSRSRRGEWRIPEQALVTLSLVGGAFGVVAGAHYFHHKTSKASFIVPAYATVILWFAILLGFGF
jgi:uncharacterized membrane protein YsdA (DUF1294 family)